MQRHGSRVVMVSVQATNPSGADADVVFWLSLQLEGAGEGLQLVTVVVSGSIGARVGQIIMQWMPVVTDVTAQPVFAVGSLIHAMEMGKHRPRQSINTVSLADE